jgi:NAD+ diphosphatase
LTKLFLRLPVFRLETLSPESTEGSLHIIFLGADLIADLRSANGCLIGDQLLVAQNWNVLRRQFLGYWHDQPCFAVEIDPASELDPMSFHKGNLYQLLGRVDDALFSLAGRAAQLLDWDRDHQFCGRCGQPMLLDPVERAMRCVPCSSILYPRIAPCIIVLVTRGEELLLARSPNFPIPMYSTLAGFIEAGENVEQTLIREVREEVGVEVNNLRYIQSQAWPFPNQLMLGYFADYESGDIVCDPREIVDAQWFHYSGLPTIPPRASISGQLIHEYISQFS